MGLKETHKKLDQVEYKELKMQYYLGSRLLHNQEKKLLYLLRSRCYDVKSNLKGKCIRITLNAGLVV